MEPTGVEHPIAHVWLGRAHARAGNTAEARNAYERFLSLWKEADPNVPILVAAKAELTKLGSR